MEKINNVSLYIDDHEIIDVLNTLPPTEEMDNKTILKFLQEETIGSDFGGVYFHNEMVYTIYKFDIDIHTETDSGLIMTSSRDKYAKEQLDIWKFYRDEQKVNFSKKIFRSIENHLSGLSFVSAFFNGH